MRIKQAEYANFQEILSSLINLILTKQDLSLFIKFIQYSLFIYQIQYSHTARI